MMIKSINALRHCRGGSFRPIRYLRLSKGLRSLLAAVDGTSDGIADGILDGKAFMFKNAINYH